MKNEQFWKLSPKLSQKERARQFIPFSPLKGYKELLAQKEKEAEEQAEKRYSNTD